MADDFCQKLHKVYLIYMYAKKYRGSKVLDINEPADKKYLFKVSQ